VSVRPFFPPHEKLGSHWTDFCCNLRFEFSFRSLSRKYKANTNGKNNGHFTLRLFQTHVNISLNSRSNQNTVYDR
jgi:hypothetical protein